MIPPLSSGTLLILEETPSTQSFIAERLAAAPDESFPAVAIARHQSKGRGRLGRRWLSQKGQSLTMSMAFRGYPNHPKPWLIGMGVAIGAAKALDCRLRWPNDLVLGGKKLGGILTELLPDRDGLRIPVVGIGVNLNQKELPKSIAEIATSLAMERGHKVDCLRVALNIYSKVCSVPEPDDWLSLRKHWRKLDDTPGKRYRLPDGRTGTAMGIGVEGELLCEIEGETVKVYAADAMFGSAAPY